jgi:hypothetical protein
VRRSYKYIVGQQIWPIASVWEEVADEIDAAGCSTARSERELCRERSLMQPESTLVFQGFHMLARSFKFRNMMAHIYKKRCKSRIPSCALVVFAFVLFFVSYTRIHYSASLPYTHWA